MKPTLTHLPYDRGTRSGSTKLPYEVHLFIQCPGTGHGQGIWNRLKAFHTRAEAEFFVETTRRSFPTNPIKITVEVNQ